MGMGFSRLVLYIQYERFESTSSQPDRQKLALIEAKQAPEMCEHRYPAGRQPLSRRPGHGTCDRNRSSA
jgi:hypothetical protein